jgi:hypothetical protein
VNLAVPCTYYQRLHHLVDLSVVGGSSRQWHLWQSHKPHLNVELYGWSSDMAYGESMSSPITILDAGGVGPWKPREWWRDTSSWSKLVHFFQLFLCYEIWPWMVIPLWLYFWDWLKHAETTHQQSIPAKCCSCCRYPLGTHVSPWGLCPDPHFDICFLVFGLWTIKNH